MTKILSVKKLRKVFNRKVIAVDNVSFNINKNEIFGLIGPNGSGKTTILRMLSTILGPTSGEIKFKGHEIDSFYKNEYRKKIGYVPQGDCLYGDLTVRENLDIFSKPYGVDEKKRRIKIEKTLKKLDIYDQKNNLVRNLSGGLTKRASIASALIHEPDILFFDEITMGLDPNSRYQIWNLIRELKKDTTIILTTHYMDEAEGLCNRIAILSEGRILDLASPQNIIESHQAKDLNEVMGIIIEEEK